MSNTHDSLRHSHARINAYKALSSPSLIALSSRDPLLTAFELSWELRRLRTMESEFRNEYNVSIHSVIYISWITLIYCVHRSWFAKGNEKYRSDICNVTVGPR